MNAHADGGGSVQLDSFRKPDPPLDHRYHLLHGSIANHVYPDDGFRKES